MRINIDTYDKLSQLAQDLGISKQRILDQALEKLRREKLFEKANKAYEAIQKDPKAWQEELDERALWDTTLSDGLEND